ncbi:MAG: ATP-binding protein [Fimbriimonadaceae bacterium]
MTLPRDVWSLFDVSFAADGRGLEGYLATMLDRCASWFDAAGASIFLAEENGHGFVLAAKSGSNSRVPSDARILPGRGIAGVAIERGEPMLVLDPEDHPFLKDHAWIRHEEIGSSLVLPLVAPETGAVGVMNLSRGNDQPTFLREDLDRAFAVARHLALAVANAVLIARMHDSQQVAQSLAELLETVIASAGVGLLVVGRDGSILQANPEARSAIGSSPRPDQSWVQYVERAPSELAMALREALDEALDGRRARRRATGPKGETAWSVVAAPMSNGGATVAIEDVTEHEQMIRELNRARRLAEIGQMTAAIAHEIRNPLASIRGAAQVVQTDPSLGAEFGRIIEDESLKLNDLCSEFLDFARPTELNLRHVNLTELVENLVALHRREFEQAGVTLRFEVSPGAHDILADPPKLERVLRNLLLNALQACERGGEVVIRAGFDEFEVADNGVGMNAAAIEKLFTPFFTTKTKGTGLGLATVRKIVDAHGGTISVESAVGKGTTFRVKLNRKPSA